MMTHVLNLINNDMKDAQMCEIGYSRYVGKDVSKYEQWDGNMWCGLHLLLSNYHTNLICDLHAVA